MKRPWRQYRHCVGVVLILAGASVLTGCLRTPQIPPAPGVKPSRDGSVLSVSPSPAHQLTPTTFTVTPRPTPPKSAVVTVALTMPSMPMPEMVISMHPDGKGGYVGSGMFSMSGDWQARIRVKEGARQTETAVAITVN